MALSARYITTSTIDSLSDHLNGNRECLISADLPLESDTAIPELIEYLINSCEDDRLVQFTDEELRAAIAAAIEWLPTERFTIANYSDVEVEEGDEDCSCDEVRVWVGLSW